MKGGDILVDLEKGGGGMTPLTNYALWYISIEFYLLYQKVNVSLSENYIHIKICTFLQIFIWIFDFASSKAKSLR